MIIPTQTSIFNESFVRYLKSIGIENPTTLKRCKHIFTLCDKMTRETINDILITDTDASGEARDKECFWCFTNNYASEARNFLTGIDLEILPIGQRISHWSVNAVDYELGETTPASKLSLIFTTQGLTRELKAAKSNCKHLNIIVDKYIKLNMPFG